MGISDDRVIAELNDSGGAKVDDYFLIGHEICALNSLGELYSLVIDNLPGEEDGEMHAAAESYLRRRGAKAYNSLEEYREQAFL